MAGSFLGLSCSLSTRRWRKCLYLSKPVVLEQPTRVGDLQGVSSFCSLPFPEQQILAEHRIEQRGAVPFGDAHLQPESRAMFWPLKQSSKFHYDRFDPFANVLIKPRLQRHFRDVLCFLVLNFAEL